MSFILALLKYAIASHQTKQISHVHQHVDSWVWSWSLSISETRTLYQLLATVYTLNKDSSTAVKYLSKYLRSSGNEAPNAEDEGFITSAVVNAIKSPIDQYSVRVELLEVCTLI